MNINEEQKRIFSEIIKNEHKREIRTLSRFACRSTESKRYNKEDIPDRINIRPSFFHDTDRIIHSKAYTRYIDKTQVFSLFDNDHITHRVLHVQLVSKIARMIGRCLRLNEDLIEAISLAHDLGHVPYGHEGERYLNEICIENSLGYFCHNAQSVKFLMELENRGKGLNLSLQVLDGVLSHNGEIIQAKYEPDKSKDWKKFFTEYENCFKKNNFSRELIPMTLEGCVVRISDVIAYIGRDFEDAIKLKLINRTDLPDEVTEVLGSNNSSIINALISDIVINSFDKPYLSLSNETYSALMTLMNFNYDKIYKNPVIKNEDDKIRNMFSTLYNKYSEEMNSADKTSSIFRDYIDSYEKEYIESYDDSDKGRIVVDYISGMTDSYFNESFEHAVLPKKFGRDITVCEQ
ncbi:MAG: HD domain-containing protein [Oscillospiraceae bacterium]|nr:HD domain-containing protein [Oscillospiraceae bacterium]